MNDSTFERCEHDRENPYVMISREMAQDKSISPKAKGVLLYLLSLPKDWKIYHSQLQDGLGVGEDYINSAMDELIANGYAERTRERVKGIFQPYKYKIREFKKCSPNLKNQPGLAGPVNPGLQSKDILNKKDDDDDAREEEKNVPYEIEVISPSGKKSGFTKSDVFRHFVGKPYKTETIERALQRFIERADRVSDFYKYLESVCATIEANEHPIETKSFKKQKPKKEPEPEPEQKKEYEPGCGEGGWFEIEKQFMEKLKNQKDIP